MNLAPSGRNVCSRGCKPTVGFEKHVIKKNETVFLLPRLVKIELRGWGNASLPAFSTATAAAVTTAATVSTAAAIATTATITTAAA